MSRTSETSSLLGSRGGVSRLASVGRSASASFASPAAASLLPNTSSTSTTATLLSHNHAGRGINNTIATPQSSPQRTSSSSSSSSSSATRRSHSTTFEESTSDLDDLPPAMLARARKHQPRFHKPQTKLGLKGRIKSYCNFKEGSIAIFLVISILLLLFLTIIGGLLMRPFFTIGLLAASGASLAFVVTEASGYGPWHHHREAENRFWIVIAVILSGTIVFAPDSPLSGLGSAFPVLGIMCVLISAGWVHYYDRKLEREELGRAPHLRRVSSFILTNQESTKQKLQVVLDCLAALDYRFVAAKALNQTQIQEAELDILNMLRSCDKEELNYILTNVNLSLLFYKIKDRDLLTFNKKEVQNRTKVLELLSRERLSDLNIQARVVVLDALMNMRLKAHTSAEEWVRDIILGTHGRMLTRMKNACDLKGRVHNFHKLIYRDITSFTIRADIIAHLRREAEVVKNDGLLPKDRRKILSDVDDTLFSSGGRFPAGLDTRWPHHVLYPGVCSFYKELDLGVSASGEWEEGRQGNLAFLSARPHLYKDKCFAPNTPLLRHDGRTIAAEDVVPGDILLDSNGSPVKVSNVDHGFSTEFVDDDDSQQRVRLRRPRNNESDSHQHRPLKDMYEFKLRDYTNAHESGESLSSYSHAQNEQTLVVTYDHTMLLINHHPITFEVRPIQEEGTSTVIVTIHHFKYRDANYTQPRADGEGVWHLPGVPYMCTTDTPIEVPHSLYTMSSGPDRDAALQPYYDAALSWSQLPSTLAVLPHLASCRSPIVWQPTAETYHQFLQSQYERAIEPFDTMMNTNESNVKSASSFRRQSIYLETCSWSMFQPSGASMYGLGSQTTIDDVPYRPNMNQINRIVPLQFATPSGPSFASLCDDAIGAGGVISESPNHPLVTRLAWLVGFWLANGCVGRPILTIDSNRHRISNAFDSSSPSDASSIDLILSIARDIWEWKFPNQDWSEQHTSQVMRDETCTMLPALGEDAGNWFSVLLDSLTSMDGDSILHSKRAPIQLMLASVELRRYMLAGLIDASGKHCEMEGMTSSSYDVTVNMADSQLADDWTHVARGLGLSVGGRTQVTVKVIELVGDVAHEVEQLSIRFRISNVPTNIEIDPNYIPCVFSNSKHHPSTSQQLNSTPHVSPWTCVPPYFLNPTFFAKYTASGEDDLIHQGLAPTSRPLPASHEYVAITVPGGMLLTSDCMVVHNSERASYRIFEELRLMKNVGLHCVPTLLAGSLDSGFQMFRGLYEPMSAKKFANFTEYATLYPEFKFCFIGDNGQGDARAGEMISEALPEQVEGIFIHIVQPIHRTPGYVNYESRQRYEDLKIYFFHTYIGAALKATQLGMIHTKGLRRIVQDSILYFQELKHTLKLPCHMIDARRTELNKDIEAANEYLVKEMKLEPLTLIPADCIFHVGSMVETNWGIGRVEHFNAITGIYQVVLTDWLLSNNCRVRCYIHGSEITWFTKGSVGDAVSTRFGTGILQEIRETNGIHCVKLTEWGHAASLFPLHPGHSHQPPSSSSSSSSPYAYLQPNDFNIISAAVGDQVQTMFGVGVVTAYRAPCIPPSSSSPSPCTALLSPAHTHTPSTAIQPSTHHPTKLFSQPRSAIVLQKPGITNVSIYTVKLGWHDHGGAIAYLNGRAIRKKREPAQRRCVVQ